MPANKYLCIHGHFYQPPRENAWLEIIEMQESATPFHDWNERINFECYAPNAAARILNKGGAIRRILNNYTYLSLNFGPTLLQWIEKADAVTYRAIQDADAQSVLRNGGHGNALAQAYNHLIMPLADDRDRETQVRWGIADFVHRFGRQPEGMWLPETAADTKTLETLAAQRIRFTILAPNQAKAFRKIGTSAWTPLCGNVDSRRPYRCFLPSGNFIDLFFYHGENARSVAFEGMLDSGERFAKQLISAFDNDDLPQLSHIATDGESYGHHHHFGEMALAHCFDYIEEQNLATITNYGRYLELFPPEYEVQIHDNSSWSCAHGVERWRSDCGCSNGGEAGWNQAWRKPLREMFDWLRDELRSIFEKEASELFNDIWETRNDYIRVLLDRSRENVMNFMILHAARTLSRDEKSKALRLLEMQRHSMLMYTSCAWFFAEVSGIETTQVLQYALRAMRYAQAIANAGLEAGFFERLQQIPSNVFPDAGVIFKELVLPSELNLTRVGMHYAASSVFHDYEKKDNFLHYDVENEVFERVHAGSQRLAFGRTTLVSNITCSEKHFSFMVLYLGQQNMIGVIAPNMTNREFEDKQSHIAKAFGDSMLGEAIHQIGQFGEEKFSFWHLFKDEKRKILLMLVELALPPVESVVRDYYEDNYQLMVGMQKSSIRVPEVWRSIAQHIINRDLYLFFRNGNQSVKRLERIAAELERWDVQLTNAAEVSLAAGEHIFELIKKLETDEAGLEQLHNLTGIIEALYRLNVHPEFWKSQNLYYLLTEGFRRQEWVYMNQNWEEAFRQLGKLLNISLEGST